MSSNSSVGTSTTVSLSTQASNKFNNNNNNKKKTIFLGVAPITAEAQLYGYLIEQDSSYDKAIRDVRIPADNGGKSRCFAFITFNWHEDAEKAMDDLEGRPLDGLILRPRWATQQKSSQKYHNHKRNQKKKRSDNRQHQQKRHQQRNGKNESKGKRVSKT